jgi:hypothetical protein
MLDQIMVFYTLSTFGEQRRTKLRDPYSHMEACGVEYVTQNGSRSLDDVHHCMQEG